MTLQHSSVKNSHLKIQDKSNVQPYTFKHSYVNMNFNIKLPQWFQTLHVSIIERKIKGEMQIEKDHMCTYIYDKKKGPHFLIEFDSIVESRPLRTHSKQSNSHIVL